MARKITGYLKTSDGKGIPIDDGVAPIECFRCGVCCTCYQPQLTPREAKAIARGLKVAEKEFLARYVQTTVIGYLLKQGKRGCVFLDWDGDGRAGCTIYSFRPEACRHWVPSLARRECREGLNRIRPGSRLMRPEELYPSPESQKQFYRSLVVKDGE